MENPAKMHPQRWSLGLVTCKCCLINIHNDCDVQLLCLCKFWSWHEQLPHQLLPLWKLGTYVAAKLRFRTPCVSFVCRGANEAGFASQTTRALTLSVDAVDQSVAIKVVDDGFEACTGA